MEDLKRILMQTTEGIQRVADLLYKQQNKNGMLEFNALLSKLSELVILISQMGENQEILFDSNQYLRTLTEAMKAMEEKDNVLLADILQYDLLDQLKEFEKFLK